MVGAGADCDELQDGQTSFQVALENAKTCSTNDCTCLPIALELVSHGRRKEANELSHLLGEVTRWVRDDSLAASCVQRLVDAKCSVHTPVEIEDDDQREVPLHWAIECGRAGLFEKLCDCGAETRERQSFAESTSSSAALVYPSAGFSLTDAEARGDRRLFSGGPGGVAPPVSRCMA